jgi:hypothetical protein
MESEKSIKSVNSQKIKKIKEDPLCNFKLNDEVKIINHKKHNDKVGKIKKIMECTGKDNKDKNTYHILTNTGLDLYLTEQNITLKNPVAPSKPEGIDPCTIPKGYTCKLEGDKYVCTKMAGGSDGYQAKYLKYKAKYLALKNQL